MAVSHGGNIGSAEYAGNEFYFDLPTTNNGVTA
jgi:hypothetical protein